MRFEFSDGGIPKNLVKLDAETRKGLQAAFEFQAARSTAAMKTMAPWTDQTSAARNGLHAFANPGRNRLELILSHAVSYGIYLEVCNSGKYEVILPALRLASDELQKLINRMWGKI